MQKHATSTKNKQSRHQICMLITESSKVSLNLSWDHIASLVYETTYASIDLAGMAPMAWGIVSTREVWRLV